VSVAIGVGEAETRARTAQRAVNMDRASTVEGVTAVFVDV
jgi:hypothetical protein